jgi:hypothetical protein
MKLIPKAMVGAALAASVAMLVACSPTVEATSTQFVGANHPPPSDPANVKILRTEPTAPHDRLGEVVVDASVEPAPPVAQIEDKLRQDAAKMGADAVVVVLDRVQPTGIYVSGPWWGRSAETVSGRKLIGVAIKYR